MSKKYQEAPCDNRTISALCYYNIATALGNTLQWIFQEQKRHARGRNPTKTKQGNGPHTGQLTEAFQLNQIFFAINVLLLRYVIHGFSKFSKYVIIFSTMQYNRPAHASQCPRGWLIWLVHWCISKPDI